MAGKGKEAGNPDSAPVESRRTPVAADVGAVVSPEPAETDAVADGEEAVLDMPSMGEFAAESARPTPLDDLADIERSKLPSD